MPATPPDRATSATSAAIVGVAMVIVVAFVLVSYEQNSGRTNASAPTDRSSAASTPSPQPSLDNGRSALTGQPQRKARPVIAAKIDNVESARPAENLAAADLVYIEPVEAGLSRLIGIYSSHLPARIGPIRSARQSDLALLPQFGHPALAFSGANSALLPRIGDSAVHDVSPPEAGSAYSRSTDRPMPHNLYAEPSELLRHAAGTSTAQDIGLRFGPPPQGGRKAGTATARYPTFRLQARWSSKDSGWRLRMDGTPVNDADGTSVRPKNVIIQYTDIEDSEFHDSGGNATPSVRTTGSGRALVLRNGKAYDARWSRPTTKDGTAYTTAKGAPMTLAPGQSWIMFAPAH